MEQIQDILHENAEVLIKDLPEIFGNETLKPKEKGRNNDMSKEFYIRMKQAEYEVISADVRRLEDEKESLIQVKNEVKLEKTKTLEFGGF